MKPLIEAIQLNDANLSALRSLIGSKPSRILAPCLQVAGQHSTSHSLSIEKGLNAYIELSCESFETPHSRDDYWRIVVAEATAPKGINVRSDGALVAPCTINLYGAEPISSIEIYSSRGDWSDDMKSMWSTTLRFSFICMKIGGFVFGVSSTGQGLRPKFISPKITN